MEVALWVRIIVCAIECCEALGEVAVVIGGKAGCQIVARRLCFRTTGGEAGSIIGSSIAVYP